MEHREANHTLRFAENTGGTSVFIFVDEHIKKLNERKGLTGIVAGAVAFVARPSVYSDYCTRRR